MNSASKNTLADKAMIGIHSSWREFFEKDDLQKELIATLARVEGEICPRAEDIFAFARWPISRSRIVIIGQDPYPNIDNACGLAFSVPRGRAIPASLGAIFRTLLSQKLIEKAPEHGDLTGWCKQGVILLNAALTTSKGQSGTHINIWEPVIQKLIAKLSARVEGLIFFLFGASAAKFAASIDARCIIQKWGHPSPMNKCNQEASNPNNFIKCPAFAAANNILRGRGIAPINWDPNGEAPVAPAPTFAATTNVIAAAPTVVAPERIISAARATVRGTIAEREIEPEERIAAAYDDRLFAFVDGAAHSNGKKDATAAYAVLIATCTTEITITGILPVAEHLATNNRAELMAIRELLVYVAAEAFIAKFARMPLYIIYDSAYAHGCICEWYEKWLSSPEKPLDIRANIDIIGEAADYRRRVELERPVHWIKIKSHGDEPEDDDSDDYYYWFGNQKVDKLAQNQL